MLLAVPNVCEGRDRQRIGAIEDAFAQAGVELLDSHSDALHQRTVITLLGSAGPLATALLAGARAACEVIDMRHYRGAHPAIGALDVCPIVYLRPEELDAARDEADEAARAIASELGIPVFLYGDLASTDERRERAFFRRGGLAWLRHRMQAGDLAPDHGPPVPHPGAGATLVTARPPLAAFNVELDTPDLAVGAAVAARLRESGQGLPGVRAIAIELGNDRIQISTNVHDPGAVPLGRVVAEVQRLAAERGARLIAAELVGLVPEAGLEGYPLEVPLVGFDPAVHVIERRVGGSGG